MLGPLDLVVLHDEQPLAGAGWCTRLSFSIAASSPSVVAGLVTKEKAPRDRPCCRFSSSVTICTGMWRSVGSCFMWLSTVQPSMSGRNTSSETAVRPELARELQRVGAA